MANISETAYPRFKSSYTESELLKLFNPSEDEIIFCKKNARSIGLSCPKDLETHGSIISSTSPK